MAPPPFSLLSHLECARCARRHDASVVQALCACGGPLYARYRLDESGALPTSDDLRRRAPDLWRYHELLPVQSADAALSLGEGFTPLVPARRLARRLGLKRLFFKDESGNPTGSFKARGLSVAVARARELHATTVVLPTAGNAGGALACYAARHGLKARVYLPADASPIFRDEALAHGAEVVLVEGTIADCARRLAEERQDGWYDISTLKEPYRLEGKKTMGYELWEQMGGALPGAIVYPTGGGTGLVGMWKAFAELESLSWWKGERPKMISAQAEGCRPVVEAFASGAAAVTPYPDPSTAAEGLRVPKPLADREILSALRDSRGTAVAVTEEEIRAACRELARGEGILTSPEGGAAVATLIRLADDRFIDLFEPAVVFLTGSAFKYPSALERLAR